MFKKDRKIANQKAMIKNRDKLIEDLENRISEYKRTIANQKVSLADLRDKNEDCYSKIFKRTRLILEIKDTLEQNNYSNEEMKIRKIKELIRDFEDAN